MNTNDKHPSMTIDEDISSLSQYVSGLKFMSDRLSDILLRYTELYDEFINIEAELSKILKGAKK